MLPLISRRALLLGTLPKKITVSQEVSTPPVLKVEDKNFKCTLAVNTNDNKSYFVLNHVEWYDPITKENRQEHVVKCYIVDSNDI